MFVVAKHCLPVFDYFLCPDSFDSFHYGIAGSPDRALILFVAV